MIQKFRNFAFHVQISSNETCPSKAKYELRVPWIVSAKGTEYSKRIKKFLSEQWAYPSPTYSVWPLYKWISNKGNLDEVALSSNLKDQVFL